MASVFPLFGRIFFESLGLGGGSSLLAGISIALMPVYFVSAYSKTQMRFRSYSVLSAPDQIWR